MRFLIHPSRPSGALAAIISHIAMFDILYAGMAALLIASYAVFASYGLSIVVLAVAVTAATAPLALWGWRSQLTRARLEPELVELRRLHINDRQRLASETAALFKAHRLSPYSSCLSSLLPAPIYLSAYEVIRGLTHRAGGSALFQPRYLPHASRLFHSLTATTTMKLFGVDLARTGVVALQVSPLSAGVFLGLVGIIVAAGVWQQHLVRYAMPQPAGEGLAAVQRAAQFLPALFAISGLALPLGVTLYYGSISVARLAQQGVLIRGHLW